MLICLLLTAFAFGCAGSRNSVQSLQQQPCTPDPDFHVRYLGTGCFLMDFKGNKLLTDPFVSNPRALRTVAGTIGTDTAYLDRHLHKEDLQGVRMVTAGHAHYDHLLDLPYLCSHIPTDARLCVNSTAKHILASYGLAQPICIMDSLKGDSLTEGQWAYSADSSIRVMAFSSLHPPQFMGIHILNGRLTEDMVERPTRMRDWLQGRTHAFLADFMENGRPARRIYFSSSMAPAPFGLFPPRLLTEKSVDAIFIGASGDHDAHRYPRPIIELTRPAKVYLIHWESFFRSKDRKARAINRNRLIRFYKETKAMVNDSVPVIVASPLRAY